MADRIRVFNRNGVTVDLVPGQAPYDYRVEIGLPIREATWTADANKQERDKLMGEALDAAAKAFDERMRREQTERGIRDLNEFLREQGVIDQ